MCEISVSLLRDWGFLIKEHLDSPGSMDCIFMLLMKSSNFILTIFVFTSFYPSLIHHEFDAPTQEELVIESHILWI